MFQKQSLSEWWDFSSLPAGILKGVSVAEGISHNAKRSQQNFNPMLLALDGHDFFWSLDWSRELSVPHEGPQDHLGQRQV